LWDEAGLHFEDAIQMEKRHRTRHWLARTQTAYANTLFRRGAAGDLEKARDLLDRALETATALAMPSVISRARSLQAQIGDHGAAHAAASPIATSTTSHAFVFRREDEIWTIAYGDRLVRLKDAKGLRYIAHLLRHPGRQVRATELVGAALEEAALDVTGIGRLGDAGPILDAEAKRQYKRRLGDLRAELEEAEGFHDIGRAASIRHEIDQLAAQLSAAVGLGDRDRTFASSEERARQTVTKGIKAVLQKLQRINPALGHHLSTHIRTGSWCAYRPDPERPIDWAV